MNRTFAVLLLLTATLLGGCASSSPELRPYTADETRELALEALNRRGLSFDEYYAKKSRAARFVAEKNVGFDDQGQMSAERVEQQPGRSS
nr:lipoprotein [Pseudomonas brassicacearum subsp. brassicacearum]